MPWVYRMSVIVCFLTLHNTVATSAIAKSVSSFSSSFGVSPLTLHTGKLNVVLLCLNRCRNSFPGHDTEPSLGRVKLNGVCLLSPCAVLGELGVSMSV